MTTRSDVEETVRALLPIVAAAVEPFSAEDAVELFDDLTPEEVRRVLMTVAGDITPGEFRACLVCGMFNPEVFRTNVGIQRALVPIARRELMRAVGE